MSCKTLKDKFNMLTLESADHWDYRGTNNSERDYVHGFCTYPAMMVPKMQREMLEVCLEETQVSRPRLLDPFAGSGTILVEGMLKGLDVVGIDINPLAVLLCKAKTTIISVDALNNQTRLLFERIADHNDITNVEFNGITKWFTPQAISDLSLIRSAIVNEPTIEMRRFFWATFCEVVRLVSNSRDCTYKLHIKEQTDIDSYDKDAKQLFHDTLQYNIAKYNEFYSTLKQRGYIRRDNISYRGSVTVILANSIAYLNHSKIKYDLVFTSPPYGDNHTTVSYGQYSIMPLRWINCKDIDESMNEHFLDTLYEIDNISLGGKSSNAYITNARKKVLRASPTLSTQIKDIENAASNQVNKVISFYSDYDCFLAAVAKKMKPGAVSVWTLGNRKVAKQEILMNQIMLELSKTHDLSFLTGFTRKILNKRMPKINGYQGEEKGLQGTMTREHILIFVRGDLSNE